MSTATVRPPTSTRWVSAWPPSRSSASYRVTWHPAERSTWAAVRPATPEPTTATARRARGPKLSSVMTDHPSRVMVQERRAAAAADGGGAEGRSGEVRRGQAKANRAIGVVVGCGDPPLGSTLTPAPWAVAASPSRTTVSSPPAGTRPGGDEAAARCLQPHLVGLAARGGGQVVGDEHRAADRLRPDDGHRAAVGEGLLVALGVRRLLDLGGDGALDLRGRVPRLGDGERPTATEGDDGRRDGDPPVPPPAGVGEPGHPGRRPSAACAAERSRLVASMRSPASRLTAGASGRTLAMSPSTCSRSRWGGVTFISVESWTAVARKLATSSRQSAQVARWRSNSARSMSSTASRA